MTLWKATRPENSFDKTQVGLDLCFPFILPQPIINVDQEMHGFLPEDIKFMRMAQILFGKPRISGNAYQVARL